MKLFTIAMMMFAVASLATAQEKTAPATQAPDSACWTLTYTPNLKGEYKRLFAAKCAAEIAEARSGVAIGVAPENRAVTTVTYRDSTGKAMEASSGWAKHTEKMADIERRKDVGVAKAENPGCGWLGCYTPIPIGSGGYYSGYGYATGGSVGYVAPSVGAVYGTNRWIGTH